MALERKTWLRRSTLQRRAAIQRTGAIKRSGRIAPKRRTPAEAERIYGEPEHRAWVKTLPCAFCGVVGYSEQAHVRNGGKGRKASWRETVPACGPHYTPESNFAAMAEGCHAKFDANKRTWRALFDTDAMAARYAAEWDAIVARGESGEALPW